jgi:hypothetical protein
MEKDLAEDLRADGYTVAGALRIASLLGSNAHRFLTMSATLCLADPGSSVAVRDKNNAVEYLG